ncbi:MAG: hypothetical protein ABL929_05015 [Ferruginibacter sp.]|nr:hypothetical protein [Ferruginibacter sp.]
MKKKIQILYIVILTSASVSFAQAKKTVWSEMKTFHSFMSSTFHPAEEGNLAPLRAKADSLLITAKLWQASPIDESFKPKETNATLKKLVKQCGTINNAVKKNASDKKLTLLITQAHDIFHTIVGECRKVEEDMPK